VFVIVAFCGLERFMRREPLIRFHMLLLRRAFKNLSALIQTDELRADQPRRLR
jgi:hypothetical protein